MRDQEIIGLWEAYHQVYAPQEITEEVEIAAQYFYEMGLNEDGVDILIEDLGVEEFADWVYEIAEDYTLTEARAGGSRIEPVTAKGQKFKSGKPTGKSLERLRAQKAARREAEEKASAAKPSGLKSSLQRQSAVANAQKKQSEKSGSPKGIAGRIGAALGSAVKRAKSDIELTKKTAQTVGKAVGTGIEALNRASDTRLARQARVATKQGFKRQQKAMTAAGGALGKAAAKSSAIRDTFKAGQKLGKALRGEEVEAWIDSLIEEGYDLSGYTWEDMCEMYMDIGEARVTRAMGRRATQYRKDQEQSAYMERLRQHQERMKNDPEYRANQERLYNIHNRKEDQKESFDFFYEDQMLNGKKLTKSGMSPENRRTWNRLVKQHGPEPFTNPRTPSGSNTRSASMVSSQTPKTPIKRRTTNLGDVQIREDIFDVILEYLITEGYADTNQEALAIMANMSEEWKQDIIEDIDAILEAMRPGPRQRKLADKQYQTYGVTTRDRANAHNIAVRGDGPGTPGYEKKSTGGKGARYAGYGDQGAGNKARRRAGLEPLRGDRDPR